MNHTHWPFRIRKTSGTVSCDMACMSANTGSSIPSYLNMDSAIPMYFLRRPCLTSLRRSFTPAGEWTSTRVLSQLLLIFVILLSLLVRISV